MAVGDFKFVSEAPSSSSILDNRSVKIGTGGWAYLSIANEDKLRAYSKLFDYVEVNTTFYHMPSLKTVKSWRHRVSPGFTFSVKCHQRATHGLGLTPVEETYRVLEQMWMVLRVLRSEYLVLQTPPSLAVDEEKVREVASLLPSSGLDFAQVFWDARSPNGLTHVKTLRAEMLREGIIPVIDLAKESPVLGTGILYSRMFGPSTFNGDLLSKISRRVTGWRGDTVVLTFHGGNMYTDALRYKGQFSV
jgi:uncharacterized protein YecE (DUF72 family)